MGDRLDLGARLKSGDRAYEPRNVAVADCSEIPGASGRGVLY